jgi:polyribonucleotide nucleotidyltransferase
VLIKSPVDGIEMGVNKEEEIVVLIDILCEEYYLCDMNFKVTDK